MTDPAEPVAPLAAEDFFRSFATAILCWQHVEHSLFALFFSLFDAPVILQVSAVYYSQESFGAKLRIVDATAKVVLLGERLQGWQRLRERLKAAAQDRNVMAHHTAVADFQADNTMGFALAPAAMVPKELRRRRTKKYDAAECERIAEAFQAMAKDVDAFTAGPPMAAVR